MLYKENIKKYITSNQNRIEEILTILACKDWNVRNVEWAHHPYYIYPLEIFKEAAIFNKGQQLMFCQGKYFWSLEDMNYVAEIIGFEQVVYPKTDMKVAGSLEVSKKNIYSQIKDEKKDKIIFFLPQAGVESGAEFIEKLENKSIQILKELKKLSVESGFDVVVRYHPGTSHTIASRLVEMINKCNFDISSTGAIDSVLKYGIIAIGWATSALQVAYNYGVKAFWVRLFEDNTTHLLDSPIQMIEIEEIGIITCERDERYVGVDEYDIKYFAP